MLFCFVIIFLSVRFGSIRIINYFILLSISLRLSIFLNLSPSHFMAHHSNELCYCCYFIRFANFIYAKHFHWLDKCLAWILLLFLCFWSVLMCVFLILTISLNRVTHRIYMRCLNIIQSTFHPRNSVMLCLRFSSVSVLLWYFYIFYSKSIVPVVVTLWHNHLIFVLQYRWISAVISHLQHIGDGGKGRIPLLPLTSGSGQWRQNEMTSIKPSGLITNTLFSH